MRRPTAMRMAPPTPRPPRPGRRLRPRVRAARAHSGALGGRGDLRYPVACVLPSPAPQPIRGMSPAPLVLLALAQVPATGFSKQSRGFFEKLIDIKLEGQ